MLGALFHEVLIPLFAILVMLAGGLMFLGTLWHLIDHAIHPWKHAEAIAKQKEEARIIKQREEEFRASCRGRAIRPAPRSSNDWD